MKSTATITALDELSEALGRGLHAGLVFLNGRAAHRFTGVYRYDGEVLRNVALVDKFDPDIRTGTDVRMVDAYCALVRDLPAADGLVFPDASRDARFGHKAGSPVVSYCGVLIRTESGEPYGTLCHFDLKRCEAPYHDVELLREAMPQIYALVAATESGGPIRTSGG